MNAQQPLIRLVKPAPRMYLRLSGKEKENKEKKKENPSAYLEKLAFIALKMACERMGIKV